MATIPAFKPLKLAQNDALQVDPEDLDALQQMQGQEIPPELLSPPEAPLPVNVNGVPAPVASPEPSQKNINEVAQPPVEDMTPQQEQAYLKRQMMEEYKKSMAAQQSGLKENEASMANLKNMGGQIDLSPLMGLVDTWTGSKLASSYKAPLTEQERQKQLLQLQSDLQKQRAGISQENINMLKAIAGNSQAQNAVDRADRFDLRALRRGITGDQILKDRVKGVSRVSTALNNLFNATEPAPAQYHELDQSIRGLVAAAGPSIGPERERDMTQDIQLTIDALKQKYGKRPVSTFINDPLVHHLKEIAETSIEYNKQLSDERLNELTAGYDDVFSRHPEWQTDVENLRSATLGQFHPPKYKYKNRDEEGHPITNKQSASKVMSKEEFLKSRNK